MSETLETNEGDDKDKSSNEFKNENIDDIEVKNGIDVILPNTNTTIDNNIQQEEEEILSVIDKENNIAGMLPYNPQPVTEGLQPYKQSVGFNQVRQAAQALNDIQILANYIKDSKLSPLKTVPDITLAIITGEQYGFNFMTSVACIFPINGKPTMSIHLHRALLLSKGIYIQKDYDFETIWSWCKVSDDGQWVKSGEKFAMAGFGTLDNPPISSIKIAKFKEVDKITQYTFTRMQKQADNSFKEIRVVSKFTMSQAQTAGLLDKDNWVKYPHSMCDARSFGIGSKEIGADILFGIYSISELADANNIKYTIDENTLEERVLSN